MKLMGSQQLLSQQYQSFSAGDPDAGQGILRIIVRVKMDQFAAAFVIAEDPASSAQGGPAAKIHTQTVGAEVKTAVDKI